ncbi:MAG TPA: hypothetical protein VF702_11360 [Allosphingosinicella sp.]
MESRTPPHLWIVGALALLWNGFGSFNYVMTQMRHEAVMAKLSASQRAYIESFPIWSEAAWAFGVWGGVAGALLLLLRSRLAVVAFAVSIAGLAGTTIYQFMLSSPPDEMVSGSGLILHLAIWAIAIGLLFYALRMRGRGLLR